MLFILGFVVGLCSAVGSFLIASRLYAYTERTKDVHSSVKSVVFGREKGAIIEETPDLAKKFFDV